jgi:hypothetical protein
VVTPSNTGELDAVGVQVDEPRRDDQPFRVQHCATAQRSTRDRSDSTIADADAPLAVEPGLRIDRTPVGDDQVIRRAGVGCGLRDGQAARRE